MKKSEFNKQANEILERWGVVDGIIDTPFGFCKIRPEKMDRQNFYSLFMRFTQDFDIEKFYQYFSNTENINRFSKKWNLHSTSGEHILVEMEERLDNLNYILKRDGKVNVSNYTPFLDEILTS